MKRNKVKEEKVTVIYVIEEMNNPALDKRIQNLFEKEGFKFEGSGYRFDTGERDLTFYRKIK